MKPTDTAAPVSAINPTYKHLQARIKLGGFTIWQWAQLVACACVAFGLQRLLPLPGSWSLSIAITLAGLPAAAAIGAMSMDFDVLAYTRAWVRWSRRRRRTWAPGRNPYTPPAGYVVRPSTPRPPATTPAAGRGSQTDTIKELWS